MKIHSQEPDRIQLANLPTPAISVDRLATHWGIDRLYLKQDDLTGIELSGNKIRKLEYVVADALKSGADTLVTVGGEQSNHCRATAAVAAQLGLACHLLLRTSETPPHAPIGNLFLDQLFGASISFHSPEEFGSSREQIINQSLESLVAEGKKPYFIEMGASNPIGSWGYIRCVHELVDQLGVERAVDLYCATGSSGTQVGLMLGKALFQCDAWTVTGIPVCDDVDYFQRELRALERATVARFDLDVSEEMTPIQLLDGFIGEGYGIPYDRALKVLRECARFAGVVLEPVYTAKAMTGMLSEIRSKAASRKSLPVFVHTGGVFGLMARADLFDAILVDE